LQHGPFAVRRVDFFAGLEFDFSDGENVLRSLVQQFEDALVQLVDGFAMIGKVHAGCGGAGSFSTRFVSAGAAASGSVVVPSGGAVAKPG